MNVETESMIEGWLNKVALPTDRELMRNWFELLIDNSVESREQAGQIYFDTIYKDVRDYLDSQEEVQSLRDSKYHTLISLMGFSPETTIICTEVFRPEKLVIVYSPKASHSYDFAVQYLLQENVLKPSQINKIEINPTDHYDIYRQVRDRILKQESTETHGMEKSYIVDITGGKKVMSATAAQAAWELNIPLCYIDGQYVNMIRRPIPGTEKVQKLADPSEEKAAQRRNSALEIYERRNYKAAVDAFSESKKMNREAVIEEFGIKACQCYSGWTDLNLPAMKKKLDELQSFLKESATNRLLDLRSFDKVALGRHLDTLTAVSNNDELALIATFFELAELYRDQQRHDFACLLAYRGMESLVEIGLKNLSDGQMNSMRNLPYDQIATSCGLTQSKLKSRYVELSKEIDPKRYEKALPTRVGVVQGIGMLCILVSLHERFSGGLKSPKRLVDHARSVGELRNSSVLAHGTKTLVAGDTKKILSFAEKLADSIFEESELEELHLLRLGLKPVALRQLV